MVENPHKNANSKYNKFGIRRGAFVQEFNKCQKSQKLAVSYQILIICVFYVVGRWITLSSHT